MMDRGVINNVTNELLKERPSKVGNIIFLSLVILALDFTNFISLQGYLQYYSLSVYLISTGFFVFLMWGVWNGKNWIRWVWIVFSITGIPTVLYGILTKPISQGGKIIYSTQFVLGLIILYYLTNKETVSWFKRIKRISSSQTRMDSPELKNEQPGESERKPTLRLPGLKAWVCSGLTLSGASLPRLKRRSLAPPNGSRFRNQEEYERWKAEKLTTTAEKLQDELVTGRDSKMVPGEIWKDPFLGMEFVFASGGWFEMDDVLDGGEDQKRSVYKVYVDGFWLGRFVVTQGQWEKLMGHNPSVYKKGTDYPVEHVSWEDVQEFILRLNQKTGMNFRLPTEEEWEYAARTGGKKENWAGADNESELTEYAWYGINSGGEPHPVGRKNPNDLGSYDMSGDVWEWVQKDYGVIEQAKVVRGGSGSDPPIFLRTANRASIATDDRVRFVGFRLVLPVK
jgi:formylglycine-generating enzyme required for sulfatase activity